MTYEEIINIPCIKIRCFPDSEIYSMIDVVIDHYYKEGFPYYNIDLNKIKKECVSLHDLDTSRLELPENHLQQFMLGLNTVNSFHPEMWTTQCRNAKTPMEVFLDRELFKTALYKRIKYSVTKLAPYNIRKSLKAFGVQSVSNFRPTIAKWVYQKFAPIGGIVLDPCAGYGGRLMGAFCSHVGSYISVDPNNVSVNGNKNLYNHLADVGKKPVLRTEFFNVPFEDFHTLDKFDLVFTSPPYFNIEKYSKDENQSYIKYNTYDLWVEKFLKVLIINGKNFLKKNGYFVLNVAGKLIDDTLNIGNNVFGSLPQTYYMRLSKMLGQGDKSGTTHKVEPIFIWKNQ
jgi:16S rRNA G966 N2-methylase RsmD